MLVYNGRVKPKIDLRCLNKLGAIEDGNRSVATIRARPFVDVSMASTGTAPEPGDSRDFPPLSIGTIPSGSGRAEIF